MNTVSNEALKSTIERAIAGDKKAFETLFNDFWGMAYYYCLKYLHNEQEAQDATQDAFIILFRRIGTLKHPEAFMKFFQFILIDACRNHLKNNKPHSAHKAIELSEEAYRLTEEKTEFLPMEAFERQELRKKLQQMVSNLPKKQRAVVLLYYFHEIPQIEIANLLNMKPSSVRSYLRDARNSLKTKIEKQISEKGVSAMSVTPIPILTKILREEAQKLATPELRDIIWKNTQEKIMALESDMQSQDSGAEEAGDKTNNTLDKIINCVKVCAVLSAIIFIISLAMHLRPPDIAALEAGSVQAEEMLAAFRRIYDLEEFNMFTHRFAFENPRYFVREGEVYYCVYEKNMYDVTVFVGYRMDNEDFRISYELAPYGASGPEDVEHWVRTHLR